MRNQKGFTLIELLVVVAIIALLSTLAVVALGSARTKSRDAKRVSDIKQIQTALELYFNDKQGYPVAATALTLGGTGAKTLSSVGFADTATAPTYMSLIPSNPTPGGAAYSYTGTASTYTITFTLEEASGGLTAGAHSATPSGVQ